MEKPNNQYDIEKAYNLLAMHHSELLNYNLELEQRLRKTSIWWLIRWKIRDFFNRNKKWM